MDVRCENCQTVYEFDDARVKETGVTVKCTQCGHIFKVRKRERVVKRTLPGVPVAAEPVAPPLAAPPPMPPQPAPTDGSDSLPPGAENRVWMLRAAANGEIRKFRELTTLQQWIVERKAFKDDEISRSGDRWKKLSGIAELAPFFRVVEQAEARARSNAVPVATHEAFSPTQQHALQSSEPPTATATATAGAAPLPSTQPMGPQASLRSGAGAAVPSLPGRGAPYAEQSEPPFVAPTIPMDDDEEPVIPRRSFRGAILVAFAAIAFVVGIAGYLFAFKQRDLKSLISSEENSRGQEAYRRGREYFLLDTDEDFHNADQQLQRAQGADESNPLPVAALASVNATWARYFRDDARALEQSRPSRAEELRRSAQNHVEEAKRYANEARSLAPDDPDVNVALADFLVSEGAPAAQVEEALRRADAKRPDDPSAAYVRGVLLLRDGKPDEARSRLEHANQLNQRVTQHDLLRADYALAMMAASAGRKDEARAAAQRILDANTRHERARAIIARLDTAAVAVAPADGGLVAAAPPAAPPAAPVAAVVAGAPVPAATAPAAAPPVPAPAPAPATAPAPPTAPAEPRGFEGLVAQGNRLLERGKGKDAVKAFDKALAERPDGVDALIGLGYAYLDTEHYNAAIDEFKKALSVSPGNGEALIGVAETYKLRGDKVRSLEYYKRYLVEQPNGSKASMARSNASELEVELAKNARQPAATATEVHEVPASPPPPPPSGGGSPPTP